MSEFTIACTPHKNLVSTNCVYVKTLFRHASYLLLRNKYGTKFIYKVYTHHEIAPNHIALNQIQRQNLRISTGDTIHIAPIDPVDITSAQKSAIIEIDFLHPNNVLSPEVDAQSFHEYFIRDFEWQFICSGQTILCDFEGIYIIATFTAPQNSFVRISDDTELHITAAKKSSMVLTNNAHHSAALFSTNMCDKLGIGGLDAQLNDIFRRAFSSRVYPPHTIEKLGIEHVRGLMLHGPPGTGKTLIARQIGKILNCKEPKIINGPEVLNKYVGQSEENIRKLFIDAENDKSNELHLIIFDEIDAVCKSRGTSGTSAGANDSVVNQLLSKIDGVNSLNNILIIGMTNRLDMIDPALLRPGRFEIQIEIGLPDEAGREQILEIHTQKMKENNYLSEDVSLPAIAKMIKTSRSKNGPENPVDSMSGAEIAGLIKSATSFALNAQIDIKDTGAVHKNANESQIKVTNDDFKNAMSEVTPAFGANDDEIELYAGRHGLINYGEPFAMLHKKCINIMQRLSDRTDIDMLSLLLYGDAGTGKTSIAIDIAKKSNYPYIKIVTADTMLSLTEYQIVAEINKIFLDARKSQHSIIILDSIERLIQYTDFGPRFSNIILQAILVLVKKPMVKHKKLLVIGTINIDPRILGQVFSTALEVPQIAKMEHAKNITDANTDDIILPIPIKKLLLD